MTTETKTRRSNAARKATPSPAKAVATAPKKRAQAEPVRQAPRDPMEVIIEAMDAVRGGDFSVRLPLNWHGQEGQLAQILNEIVSHNRRLAAELSRVGEAVGREGQTRQRVVPANREGQWLGMEDSVNALIDDLVRPVEAMSEAMAGVAKGDLTRTVPLEADGRPLKGEFLRSANIVNRMI